MDWGDRTLCPDSCPRCLPSLSLTRLLAGSRPAHQEQVGVWCPVLRVTWPRLCLAPRPGRHSCGCDRRLGSDSPRHIPGPDTIFFVTLSPTPPTFTPLFLKNALSPQRVPLGGGLCREVWPGFPGTRGAGVPALGGGELLAAEEYPCPST